MGLQQDLIESITDAFDDDLNDAVKSFIIRSNDSTIDPISGGPASGANVVFSKWRGIFSKYERVDLRNIGVKPADITIIAIAGESSISPKNGFVIEYLDKKYVIDDIEQDPTFSFYFLHCINATKA